MLTKFSILLWKVVGFVDQVLQFMNFWIQLQHLGSLMSYQSCNQIFAQVAIVYESENSNQPDSKSRSINTYI